MLVGYDDQGVGYDDQDKTIIHLEEKITLLELMVKFSETWLTHQSHQHNRFAMIDRLLN